MRDREEGQDGGGKERVWVSERVHVRSCREEGEEKIRGCGYGIGQGAFVAGDAGWRVKDGGRVKFVKGGSEASGSGGGPGFTIGMEEAWKKDYGGPIKVEADLAEGSPPSGRGGFAAVRAGEIRSGGGRKGDGRVVGCGSGGGPGTAPGGGLGCPVVALALGGGTTSCERGQNQEDFEWGGAGGAGSGGGPGVTADEAKGKKDAYDGGDGGLSSSGGPRMVVRESDGKITSSSSGGLDVDIDGGCKFVVKAQKKILEGERSKRSLTEVVSLHEKQNFEWASKGRMVNEVKGDMMPRNIIAKEGLRMPRDFKSHLHLHTYQNPFLKETRPDFGLKSVGPNSSQFLPFNPPFSAPKIPLQSSGPQNLKPTNMVVHSQPMSNVPQLIPILQTQLLQPTRSTSQPTAHAFNQPPKIGNDLHSSCKFSANYDPP